MTTFKTMPIETDFKAKGPVELAKKLEELGYKLLGLLLVKQVPGVDAEGGTVNAVDVSFVLAEEQKDVLMLPSFPIQCAVAVGLVAEWVNQQTLEEAAVATKQ